jgi:hypothetical protein
MLNSVLTVLQNNFYAKPRYDVCHTRSYRLLRHWSLTLRTIVSELANDKSWRDQTDTKDILPADTINIFCSSDNKPQNR